MTILEKLRTLFENVDEAAKWIDSYFDFDDSPYMQWWDENYCKKCESIIARPENSNRDMEFAFCELNGYCKFFPEKDGILETSEIIKLWLLSEIPEKCE